MRGHHWSNWGVQAMLRVAAIVLALMVGYDHFMYNGKFVSAAMRASSQILHHFGVI
jgi:hypothetical protein